MKPTVSLKKLEVRSNDPDVSVVERHPVWAKPQGEGSTDN